MILSQIFSKILRSKATTLSINVLPLFSAGLLVMIFSSCSTTRTIPIETNRKDTVYLSNIQYDSIYIDRSSDTDRTRDTITITKTMTEYRYKLLRDTIYKVRVDSIPYEVIVYKDSPPINHKLSARLEETLARARTINLLGYLSFGILLGLLLWKLYRVIKFL